MSQELIALLLSTELMNNKILCLLPHIKLHIERFWGVLDQKISLDKGGVTLMLEEWTPPEITGTL